MAIIDTLLHYGSYLAAFYALYVVAGVLAFGLFLRHRLHQNARHTPLALRVRREPASARDGESRSH
ncbi:hypothetical protein [Herbaspirillum sp.]|uniref:hypothetical protein n=1 Tax=Herbaspirillum sp. TaxID=1890675 RepID=UPI0031D0A0E3